MSARRDLDRQATLDALIAAGEQVVDRMAQVIAVVESNDASAINDFAPTKYAFANVMGDFFTLLGEARAIQRYILAGEPDPRMSEHPSNN